MSVEFSKAVRKEAEAILRRYPTKQAAMLPILYLAERVFGNISPEVENYVGRFLEVPVVKVREVMTFYTLIPREPRGKHHIQVCHNLSCFLLGCDQMIRHLSEKLDIRPGETSADGKFTLSTVECLGACEMAPMLQLDDDYIGHLTVAKLDQILRDLK